MSKLRYQNKSIKKALRLLTVFDATHRELSLTELARELDMLPGSLYSIILPLEEGGYLTRDPHTKRYRLGMGFLERANTVLSTLDLREQSKPEIRQLTHDLRANSYLGVLYKDNVLYLDREEAYPDRSSLSHPIIGYRDFLHATALGKVLLAFNPEVEKQVLELETLPSITIQTITDTVTLERELDIVRRRGYALDREESQLDNVCLAAPVYNFESNVVAAISISMPKTLFDHESINATANSVMKAASRISVRMGYTQD
jgi:IclR family transcriptional regulator, KDG regulon repressor